MWPFRRKTYFKKPDPKPAWLKWLLIAFLGYVLVMASVPDSPDRPNPINRTVIKAKTDLKNQEMLNIEGYKDKLFPDYMAGLRIKEIAEGSGKPAICGQKVALAYQAYLAQGNEIPDRATADKPLSFTIGEHATMPVFEQSALGMNVGGKRSVLAPPMMSYGLEDYKRDDVPSGANIRFEIELLSASPEIPDQKTSPYRIAEVATGDGTAVSCGQETGILVTIWDARGKQLYKHDDAKNPLKFTPGKSGIMLGIEQGVIGMRTGGTRLFVIPPDFQKTMHGNKPTIDFPLPASEVLLVEVIALY